MLTDTQRKALIYIQQYGEPKSGFFNYTEFAKHMWPDSNMHITTKNTGNGSTRGKAAWLCAGSYIGRLEKLELVRKVFDRYAYTTVRLTEKGKKMLLKCEG